MFWESYISNKDLINIGISLGIFLVFLLFRRLFSKYVFAILIKFSKRTATKYVSKLLVAFKKPMRGLFVVIGLYIAVGYFPYLSQSNVLFIQILKAWLVVLIGAGLYNVTSVSSVLFTSGHGKGKFKIDKILIPFISQGARFIIVAITLSLVISVFGYNINGFVAGLGLGGLAFALAAQDALSNLFGGFVILTEKPFTVDEWILTPSVEGTVEEITFRSTRVRTFAQALVTVPNATLANEPITNWSKMGKRQITFNLRIMYDTPIDKIRNVVGRIEELLKSHEEVHQETVFVSLNDYKENGVDVLLYFFTKTTVWAEYLDIRQSINFSILEILESEGVAVAVPTRRLFSDKKTDLK